MTRKAKSKSNGFIMLDHDFLRSERFVALSPYGKAQFLGMADCFNGRNADSVTYSIRQARTWMHCGAATAHRAFAELQGADLIEAVERGSFSIKTGQGRATTWRLKFLK